LKRLTGINMYKIYLPQNSLIFADKYKKICGVLRVLRENELENIFSKQYLK